ncbi:MAG: nucleoside-diphosphate kinase [Planctomycetota bacterium]|nr:nucleoside-diphosphate kinase [Planctomycetota bacterium]MDI6787184.1 nucleoside-diphosphate kinase [Planctomycetota bacterium]
MEKTLVIIKPDGVQRKLIGEIISRFEHKGLKIVGLKMMKVSPKQAETLYAIHKKKQFYQGLLKFITAGTVVTMVVEGIGAVNISRKLLGATFGADAEPGTIRGDFGASISYNLVHASDSPETAQNEIAIFFKETEILSYILDNLKWVYHPSEEEEMSS